MVGQNRKNRLLFFSMSDSQQQQQQEEIDDEWCPFRFTHKLHEIDHDFYCMIQNDDAFILTYHDLITEDLSKNVQNFVDSFKNLEMIHHEIDSKTDYRDKELTKAKSKYYEAKRKYNKAYQKLISNIPVEIDGG